MSDYYDCGDPGSDFFELFLGFLLLGWVFAWIFFFIYAFSQPPKPSKGYGGSPGHMSPMEVEALYEKNRP